MSRNSLYLYKFIWIFSYCKFWSYDFYANYDNIIIFSLPLDYIFVLFSWMKWTIIESISCFFFFLFIDLVNWSKQPFWTMTSWRTSSWRRSERSWIACILLPSQLVQPSYVKEMLVPLCMLWRVSHKSVQIIYFLS